MNLTSNMTVTHVQKCEKNVPNLKKYKCTTCSFTIFMFCAGTVLVLLVQSTMIGVDKCVASNISGVDKCGIRHFRGGQVWHQTFQGWISVASDIRSVIKHTVKNNQQR
jgi:hypothetical protein